MSLRARLLVLMVLLSLLVLGVIATTGWIVRTRGEEREANELLAAISRQFGNILPEETSLREASYTIEPLRRLLDVPFQYWFEDIVIQSRNGFIDVNPLGSAHRDPTSFPLREIRAGIQAAIESGTVVTVANGICLPIRGERGGAAGREVEGAAWLVPLRSFPQQVSFLAYAVPFAVSIVVFGVLASLIIGRTIGRPLDQLGSVARRLEAGHYDARVPDLGSAPELAPLVDAFNSMAAKVEGHTAELEREVRRATEEAAAKERALLVSSRLASMGTLASGIAHEINNPIGGMLNAAHRLAQSTALTERESSYIGMIQRGLERVARTARKLLDFSPKVIAPVPFAVATAVDAARELVEHRFARERVRFTVDLPGDLPQVVGDPHEIEQVLLNVLLNSLNALAPCGGGRIDLTGAHRDGEVELTILDDGPGAPPAVLARVLDPFFSTSSHPESTGLGLFISYTIVQNHGGDLTVRSAPGEGFEVRIRLPARPDAVS